MNIKINTYLMLYKFRLLKLDDLNEGGYSCPCLQIAAENKSLDFLSI